VRGAQLSSRLRYLYQWIFVPGSRRQQAGDARDQCAILHEGAIDSRTHLVANISNKRVVGGFPRRDIRC